MLSVDWVRTHFSSYIPGAFQANWLVTEENKLIPRGRSRAVDIIGENRARARNGAGAGVAFGQPSSTRHTNGARAEVLDERAIPSELVDVRIKFVEEIASMRLATQKEIFGQQIAAERQLADMRNKREREELEARIEALESGDPDEPDEWGWLKDLVQEIAPALKAAVPLLLAKLGGAAK